jgi:hypothetical protein
MEYCSCRHVMNSPAEYCQAYVKQYLPTSGFVDKPGSKRVTASGMGRSNTAAWFGERQGCRLIALTQGRRINRKFATCVSPVKVQLRFICP